MSTIPVVPPGPTARPGTSQDVGGVSPKCRLPASGVLCARLRRLRLRQPDSIRLQLGPATGGTLRPTRIPSGSRSRRRTSLPVALWRAGVHSATDST
ncbi:hypothetical protein NDU88_003822 [Pleurodeles waltl]|uniref:Uncharacterized protein n=1 Tax=Pleurodeles waltl TaxID=8319 RepID=A0AAV7VGX2_PLEWA|nr:hypothetical protein NDU88_003822 [Pleurodeles waltl]